MANWPHFHNDLLRKPIMNMCNLLPKDRVENIENRPNDSSFANVTLSTGVANGAIVRAVGVGKAITKEKIKRSPKNIIIHALKGILLVSDAMSREIVFLKGLSAICVGVSGERRAADAITATDGEPSHGMCNIKMIVRLL
ncbi:hypothetical protein L1887_30859 [Cichorium endivia]|nr:hypothetical protein L1887_30859 [Cichorium endivia]